VPSTSRISPPSSHPIAASAPTTLALNRCYIHRCHSVHPASDYTTLAKILRGTGILLRGVLKCTLLIRVDHAPGTPPFEIRHQHVPCSSSLPDLGLHSDSFWVSIILRSWNFAFLDTRTTSPPLLSFSWCRLNPWVQSSGESVRVGSVGYGMVHPGVARFRLLTTLLGTNNGHFVYQSLVFPSFTERPRGQDRWCIWRSFPERFRTATPRGDERK
jgi:hypothetical protein